MNQTIDIIKKRKSIRSFNDKRISQEIIQELLDCARQAPSAMNRQEWKFIVIDDKDYIKQMSKALLDDIVKTNPKTKERSKTMKDPIFYGAPALILILRPKDNKWAQFDCSAAAQNILIAATSLGIGSIPLGKGSYIEADKKIMEKLKIPDDHTIHIVIALGYSDQESKAPERKTDNITWI